MCSSDLVELDLDGPDALRAACRRILVRVRAHHPAARIDGLLVQSMERGLAEAIVGFRRDPNVGPVVVLGAGGTLAEVYRDFSVRIAPVGMDEALRMVAEVKGLAPIRGYRNLPRGDCDALARAVHAVSLLACIEGAGVAEAEINPLIVRGEGVVAVDGLIVPGPTV